MANTITHNGQTHTIPEWATIIGVSEECLRARLGRYGWTVEEALETKNQRTDYEYSESKHCKRCGETKPLNDFRTYRRSGRIRYMGYCSKCEANRMSEYRQKQRIGVLEKYCPDGIQCGLCPEQRTDVLEIDHVHGNGKLDRDKFNNNSSGYYVWLLEQPVMPGYRVLCRNCNWIEYLRMKGARKLDDTTMMDLKD